MQDELLQIRQLPDDLLLTEQAFERLWQLHPAEHARVKILGKSQPIPRWQTAYEADYRFSGTRAVAQPAPKLLKPCWTWARDTIDPRLNGLLVNWYDAAFGHYIGEHRDDVRDLIPGSPIVTVSFGAERTFRLIRGTGAERLKRDYDVSDGSVLIIPWDTNRLWKHSVPKLARNRGRRVSVTLRAFRNIAVSASDELTSDF